MTAFRDLRDENGTKLALIAARGEYCLVFLFPCCLPILVPTLPAFRIFSFGMATDLISWAAYCSFWIAACGICCWKEASDDANGSCCMPIRGAFSSAGR